ncbi:MAG: demethoxyubiquinone hydroxylase family protein [Gammaproteobacteria bacterium]
MTVFYDGACPVCSREIGFYRRRAGAEQVDWVDASDERFDAGDCGLSRGEALARFHVRTGDGRLVSGVAAFAELWRALPATAWLGWLLRPRWVRSALEPLYALFLKLRQPPRPAVARFDALPRWLQRELRSNHAGEVGAVWIYRAMLALTRDPAIESFATRHLDTELKHLGEMQKLVPPERRSRLLVFWIAAAAFTGALPALLGRRAVFVTIDAVESFVDRHYASQIERLQDAPEHAGIRAQLEACHADELAHRDEARARADTQSISARAWFGLVGAGSAAAVVLARRV